MVSRSAEKSAAELWAELEALPEHLKGEIIDGQLHVQPRPRARHARGIGFLVHFLGGGFDYGEGGPGGWWIVPEPGIEGGLSACAWPLSPCRSALCRE